MAIISGDYKNESIFKTVGGAVIEDKDFNAFSKDDFLKLFLTELQHQDPLAPMDTQKMLDQTMQLSTIEAQTNQTKTLEAMTKAISSQANMVYVNAVDKYVKTSLDTMHLADGIGEFNFFSPSQIQSGSVSILDENDNVLRTIPIDGSKSGVNSVYWNGEDSLGNLLPNGDYKVKVSATDEQNSVVSIVPGKFKINSIKISNGEVFADIGVGVDVPASDIQEFFGI
jgi:flagellar basal-body rod modification protein FlgD